MNWIVVILLIGIVVGIVTYQKMNKYTVVRAGVQQYVPGEQTNLKLDINLPKQYKKSHVLLARAMEIGPSIMDKEAAQKQARYWYPHDYLVVNNDFSKFMKGHFYLLTQDDKFKIAMCTAAAWGFPPIFVGSDTLVESQCVGEVIGVIDAVKKDTDYHIMTIPCPVA